MLFLILPCSSRQLLHRPRHQDRTQPAVDLGAGHSCRSRRRRSSPTSWSEILPDLFRSRTAQRTARGFQQGHGPGRDLRRYENEARVGGNVASRQRYAEELVRHERYDEAIAQYRQALTGLYEHDPNLMLGLAQAQFAQGRCERRAHYAR